MKTLDEVITHLSTMDKEDRCMYCPFDLEKDGSLTCALNTCVYDDALHYLKEYPKVDSNYWSEKAISELNNIADAYFLRAYREDKDELTALRAFRKEQHENIPLTWEELKQMEGKPVWVEWREADDVLVSKQWTIIAQITDTDNCQVITFMRIDSDGYPMPLRFSLYDKACLREGFSSWQAYRKERK